MSTNIRADIIQEMKLPTGSASADDFTFDGSGVYNGAEPAQYDGIEYPVSTNGNLYNQFTIIKQGMPKAVPVSAMIQHKPYTSMLAAPLIGQASLHSNGINQVSQPSINKIVVSWFVNGYLGESWSIPDIVFSGDGYDFTASSDDWIVDTFKISYAYEYDNQDWPIQQWTYPNVSGVEFDSSGIFNSGGWLYESSIVQAYKIYAELIPTGNWTTNFLPTSCTFINELPSRASQLTVLSDYGEGCAIYIYPEQIDIYAGYVKIGYADTDDVSHWDYTIYNITYPQATPVASIDWSVL